MLDLLLAMPLLKKKRLNSLETNIGPLSKCTKHGVPHKVNNLSRQLITTEEVISLQGNAKGKREYSSIAIISKYLLFDEEGKGPLNPY